MHIHHVYAYKLTKQWQALNIICIARSTNEYLYWELFGMYSMYLRDWDDIFHVHFFFKWRQRFWQGAFSILFHDHVTIFRRRKLILLVVAWFSTIFVFVERFHVYILLWGRCGIHLWQIFRLRSVSVTRIVRRYTDAAFWILMSFAVITARNRVINGTLVDGILCQRVGSWYWASFTLWPSFLI